MINKNTVVKYAFIIFASLLFLVCPIQAKTIAVLPFDVLSENKEYKQFGLGTMDSITVALTGIPDLTMIDRGHISNILKEQAFQNSGFTDIKESVKTGKVLGAQIIVTGAIQTFDNQFRVTASFIDVETGKVIKAAKVTGNNIFDLQDKIAEQLIQLENVKLTTEQRNEVTKITKATGSTTAYDNYTQARTYYYKLLEISFSNSNKLSDKEQLEIFNKTLDYLNKALEADPKYFLAVASKAETQALLYAFYVSSKEIKDVEKAKENLKQAEANAYLAYNISDNSGSVYRALALVNYIKGEDAPKILDYCIKALKYNPNDREIYSWVSLTYYRDGFEAADKGDFTKSIENFENCIKYSPNFSYAYSFLGKIYEKINQTDKAIETYEKGLKNIHSNELTNEFIQHLNKAYQTKANEYYQKSDFVSLEKVYNSMLKYQPENPDLYNNLAIAFVMQKKYIQAEEMYKKAITIKPDNGSFYDNLALLYQTQGNNQQADIFFKKACELGNKASCK